MNTPLNPSNNPAINPEINPEDPKWTAYVLGEATEAERLEIERLLETSEEARALIEELTFATETLRNELTPTTGLMMSAEQRAAIMSAAEPKPRRWFEMFPSKWGMGLAAAAVLVLVVALPIAWRNEGKDEFNEIAAVDKTKADRLTLTVPTSEAAPAANESVQAEVGSEKLQARLSKEIRESRQEADSERQTPPVGAVAAPVLTPQEFAEVAQGGPPAATPTAADKKVEAAEQLLKSSAASVGTPPQATPPPPPPPPALLQSPAPPPVANVTRDGLSVADNRAQQGQQQGQGQGQGQGQQGGGVFGGAAGGRGGGGGGRGGGIGARGAASTTINPDLVGEARVILTPVDAERGNASARARAAAPPPAPPAPAAAPARADFNRLNTPNPNTEAYAQIIDNPFIRTTQEPLATFSIDVDTASYANVRRFLNQNQLPPRDAVRIEELVNYFSYDYAQPSGNVPIAPNMEVAAAPWNPANRLVRIGIKAREVNANRRPASNLVFLVDVSGSMNSPEKLPLVKAGLNMLVENIGENDMVSMVVYAGSSGLVLPPTSGMRKETIRQAIDRLEAGGSTNGGAGIQLAYNQATVNFLRNGTNRVILMTDGDFNVGVTNQGDLTRLIQERARSGVFLSVLGFGMGNIKDSTLERLADQGNGNYAYIDNLTEARKVLVEEMSGTLITVAKDVKIQVDFNPAKVEAYRLIGYENRVLRTEDFNNDAKDAGDMGAGHTVTALFEVVPKGGQVPGGSVDPSKYTQPAAAAAARADANAASTSPEMLNLRVRYKEPNSDTSQRMDVPLTDRGAAFNRATADFRFAASVAQFGMVLRESPYRGSSNMESVLDIAQGSRGADRNGYRAEFITLVQKARNLGR